MEHKPPPLDVAENRDRDPDQNDNNEKKNLSVKPHRTKRIPGDTSKNRVYYLILDPTKNNIGPSRNDVLSREEDGFVGWLVG
jgi:hypothetical protein